MAQAGNGSEVELENVRLSFGDRRVFTGLTCGFPDHGISVVLGASGSGKTSLLRMMASLLRPDAGRIRVGVEDITALAEARARSFRRRIGMLFQGGALLDSMTVFDNVALPMREHTRMSEAEIADRIHAQFEAVGLDAVDELLPAQLSGGMVKRAALARAMILEPQILLCDEPFTGLDPVNVRVIEDLLADVNGRVGITMILTSHHISSTLRIADHVAFILDGGAVCGSADEIHASSDPRIARFLEAATPPSRALAETRRGAAS